MAVIDALSTPAAREINRKIYGIKKEYSQRRRRAESIYIMKRGGEGNVPAGNAEERLRRDARRAPGGWRKIWRVRGATRAENDGGMMTKHRRRGVGFVREMQSGGRFLAPSLARE